MSQATWFYASNGQQSAAMTWETLAQMATSGALRREDLVWAEGMPQWVPAGTVPNLFPAMQFQTQGFASGPYAHPSVIGYQTLPTGAQNYAGFWIRAGAAMIDGLILFGINMVVSVGVELAFSGGRKSQSTELAALGINQVSSLVIGWLYSALQESSPAQATVGKRAVGIKVVNYAGEQITFGRATARHFGKIISGLIIGIGYFMVGWTEKKQGLHDQMASTLVVKA